MYFRPFLWTCSPLVIMSTERRMDVPAVPKMKLRRFCVEVCRAFPSRSRLQILHERVMGERSKVAKRQLGWGHRSRCSQGSSKPKSIAVYFSHWIEYMQRAKTLTTAAAQISSPPVFPSQAVRNSYALNITTDFDGENQHAQT